jgi:radical SAM superfamily enzyme YgiQ (UPF0313 family)
MKILLVNQLHSIDKNDIKIQIGPLILTSILKKSKIDIELIDFNKLNILNKISFSENSEKNLETITNYLVNKKPDIIGFSCMCNNYHVYIKTAHLIKKSNPNIKIIFGGPQASLTAKETLKAFDFIDLIVIGESEKKILNILELLFQNKDLTQLSYFQLKIN